MRARLALPALLAAACAGSSSNSGLPQVPPAVCDPIPQVDASHPTTTVTDCTQAGLQAAADRGGIIYLACPGATPLSPVTITVTSPIVFRKETVLDGGSAVTLSGGGTSRILYLDSAWDQTGPRLTVQRLTFVNGASPRTGEDTADGGAAIYRDGGSLTVIDCLFDDNHAPSTGQDLAGGAIYGFGGGETVISGSTFTNNSASDGGAVGSLQGDLVVVNSSFTGNAATGTGGNPGDGGCGGAIYMDGVDERTSLCGVTISNNRAGAIGGGFFRVSNTHDGTFAMERSTVDSNEIVPAGTGNSGGLYLEGLGISITNSTISRNRGSYNGGIWMHTSQVALVNVTVSENVASGSDTSNAGGICLSSATGALVNCTIEGNSSSASGGAIFGGGITLRNTIVVNNTARWHDGCGEPLGDAGGNLEWPEGVDCTANPVIADPLLGTLQDNGGPAETLLPAPASPARGRGRNCPAADERGLPRGDPCTSGAVEVP